MVSESERILLGLVKTGRFKCRWTSFLFVRTSNDHISVGVEYGPKGTVISDQRNLVSPMRSRAQGRESDLASAKRE